MNRDQYSAKLQWRQGVFSAEKRPPEETRKRESSAVGKVAADLLPVRVGDEGLVPIEGTPDRHCEPKK